MAYKLIYETKKDGEPRKVHKHRYSEERFARFAAALKLKQMADDIQLGKLDEARLSLHEIEEWEVDINEEVR